MSPLFKQIITLGILMALFFAIQLFAFTEPTLAPPAGNVPTTFNVGPDAQVKEGGVILANLSTVVNGLAVRYGNVGIGTLTPQRLVHLKTDNAGTPSMLALENINLGVNNGATLSFRGKVSDGTEFKEFTAIQTIYEDHTSAARKGSLNLFSSTGVINGTPQITIKSDGMIDVKNNRIVNVPMPIDDTDVASKAYVLAQAGGGKFKSQEFKTVGANTFTPTTGVTLVWVTLVGGGGGGNWGSGSGGTNSGGGGGGGGEVRYRFPVAVSGAVTVTIGAGGTGGGNGVNSTFGTLLTALGGKGGSAGSGGTGGGGGAGGGAKASGVGPDSIGSASILTYDGETGGSGGGGGSGSAGGAGGSSSHGSSSGGGGNGGGGGGGGSWGNGGWGGSGGGGSGGAAAANTGGGGGGAGGGIGGVGAAGGSGYAFIEWFE